MLNDFHQKPFSNMELAAFCNQMSMLLRSGISSLEGLNLLLEDAQTQEERQLLTHMIHHLEQTGCLYEAASATAVFPDYAIYMIQLGEETGTLDDIMNRLFIHYTREEHMNHMIRNSFVYPFLMLGMMTLVIVVLLTKVMPVFHQVFQQLGQELSGFSAGLLNIGETLSHYSIIFILFLILIIGIAVFKRNQFPLYKNLQNKVAVCRFMDGMSIALKSGMTPEQSLDLVSRLIENEGFQSKIHVCKSLLENGQELAGALRESQILTGSYARIASIAQKAGTLDEAMNHISDEYEYSINNKITQYISLLEPTLVIVLSLIVGVILFSVMIPLLGIMSSL